MKQKSFKVQTDSVGEVTVETRGKRGIYIVRFNYEGENVKRTLKSSNKNLALQNLDPVIKKFLGDRSNQKKPNSLFDVSA